MYTIHKLMQHHVVRKHKIELSTANSRAQTWPVGGRHRSSSVNFGDVRSSWYTRCRRCWRHRRRSLVYQSAGRCLACLSFVIGVRARASEVRTSEAAKDCHIFMTCVLTMWQLSPKRDATERTLRTDRNRYWYTHYRPSWLCNARLSVSWKW